MMLIWTPCLVASRSQTSAIFSAVARLMVVKSCNRSAALPLTTNCSGTFWAKAAPASASALTATADNAMLRFMVSLPDAVGAILPRTREGHNGVQLRPHESLFGSQAFG